MKKSRQIFGRSNRPKLQLPKSFATAAAIAAAGALLIGGVGLSVQKYGNWWETIASNIFSQGNQQANSPILPIATLPASDRSAQLEAIAAKDGIDGSRARYLLAADAIAQKQGQAALKWLEGLEWRYGVMSPYIALKRARAYEAMGDAAKAKSAWQEVLNNHSDRPAAADALSALGKTNPKDWQTVLEKFPSHPLALQAIRGWLQKNPNQPQLILALAKYGTEQKGTADLVEKLTKQPGLKFKPEEWEAIAWAFWQNREYGKASQAYIRAPKTPENAYRIARGFQLSAKNPEAKIAYQQVLKDFPASEQAALSLLRLASLSESSQAILYLEEAISRYPDQAGDALIAKARIFDKMKLADAAKAARQLLLKQYSKSEAAANYRWAMAQQRAAARDFQGAWQWAREIGINNPDSEVARQALFWEGKWALLLGKRPEAKAAFEKEITNYTQSYYAWRAAVMLGWQEVGDFTTVRQLAPQIERPIARPQLAVGSELMRELHAIGQDQDALAVWQAEFQNRLQPTIAEQFTDGVLRIAAGDRLRGISLVATLEDREKPEEKAEYQKLRNQMEYWLALYPFPFMKEVEKWAAKRQINPLLVISLIRQESRFEPEIKSVAGALGLMQVLPSTAAWAAEKIKLDKYSLKNPGDNILLGTWFLDHTHQIYKNNSMLAVASYNAGPGNVSKWLQEKSASDLDEFVESIPFDETRGYVKNVFGNYWNYLRLYNPEISQKLAKYNVPPSINPPTAQQK